MLHFEGRKVYIDKLKRLLPKWWKYAANILTQFSFFINLLLRVPINGRKYRLEKQQSVRIIRIRITGRIFNAQSAYFSGETCFARINRMFELRIIRHSNYKIMNSTVWSVIRLNSLILKESWNYQCVSKRKLQKLIQCHCQSIYCLAAFVIVGQDIIISLMVLSYSILKELFLVLKYTGPSIHIFS